MISEISPLLKKLLLERQEIDVIYSHTCGQPTRVILNATSLADGMSSPPPRRVKW